MHKRMSSYHFNDFSTRASVKKKTHVKFTMSIYYKNKMGSFMTSKLLKDSFHNVQHGVDPLVSFLPILLKRLEKAVLPFVDTLFHLIDHFLKSISTHSAAGTSAFIFIVTRTATLHASRVNGVLWVNGRIILQNVIHLVIIWETRCIRNTCARFSASAIVLCFEGFEQARRASAPFLLNSFLRSSCARRVFLAKLCDNLIPYVAIVARGRRMDQAWIINSHNVD